MTTTPEIGAWEGPMMHLPDLGPNTTDSSSGLPETSSQSPQPSHTTQGSISSLGARLGHSSLDFMEGVYESSAKARDVQTAVDCGLIPVLCLLGVVGNCLCVLVFLRQRYKSSAKPLLVALCLSDVGFLLCSFVTSLPCLVGKADSESRGRSLRVYLTPQADMLRVVLSRVVVAVTLALGVERSVAVTRPLKLRALCTVARTKSAVLAILITVLALQTPAFLRYDVKHRVLAHNSTQPELHQTGFYTDNRRAVDFYLNYFLLIMLRGLPILSICVCIGIVWVSLKRRLQYAYPRTPKFCVSARDQVRARREAENEHGDLVLEERKLTRVLLVVLFLCVLSELPDFVTRVFHVMTPGSLSESYVLARDISRFICVLNASVNFIVFDRLYKHFSVTFKTVAGLCS